MKPPIQVSYFGTAIVYQCQVCGSEWVAVGTRAELAFKIELMYKRHKRCERKWPSVSAKREQVLEENSAWRCPRRTY